MNTTHCGDNAFSPQAPDCNVHTVPEPSTLVLLTIALTTVIVARLFTRLIHG